jgi:hypothetical protein
MPELIVPVLNEIFGTNYPLDVPLEQLRNEHQTLNGEKITDSYFRIGKKGYHFECQSTGDSKMVIRMVEYDFAISIENVKKETKAQTAQRLYDEFKGAATSTTAGTKAAELLAFKKASKKSWTALGLSDDIGELVTEKATSVAPKVAVKTVSGFDDLKAKAPKAGSPKAQMAEVLKGSKINVEIANKALAIKRSAKKSWAVLGVSDEVAVMIESLTK